MKKKWLKPNVVNLGVENTKEAPGAEPSFIRWCGNCKKWVGWFHKCPDGGSDLSS